MSEFDFDVPGGADHELQAKAKKALIDAMGAKTAAPAQSRYDLLHPALNPPKVEGDGEPREAGPRARHDIPENAGSEGERGQAQSGHVAGHHQDAENRSESGP